VTKVRKFLLIGALVLLPALPAAALDDIFSRALACDPILTVHKMDCSVEIIFRCPADGEPYIRHEAYEDAQLDTITHTRGNGDLVQLSDADGQFHVEFVSGDSSPSPDEIMRAGSARFEQEFMLTIMGITRSAHALFLVRPEGSPFQLGRNTLLRIRGDVELVLQSPMPTLSGTTAYYVDLVEGIEFEGESHIDVLDDSNPDAPAIPVRLIRKGEPGFASPEPGPDCQTISAVSAATRQETA